MHTYTVPVPGGGYIWSFSLSAIAAKPSNVFMWLILSALLSKADTTD